MVLRDNEYPTLEFVGEDFSRVFISALETWNGSLAGLLVFERDNADDFIVRIHLPDYLAANLSNFGPLHTER